MIEVAGDESGSEGENLANATHRFFTYGTTSVSVDEASEIICDIRVAIGSSRADIDAARELKSATLLSRHPDVVASTLRESLLASSASVYVADKWFFLAGKMVSLIVEEQAAEIGVPIASIERMLAVELMDQVVPAIGNDLWSELMTAFNQVVRIYHPASGATPSAMPFLRALNRVRGIDHGGYIVTMLWQSREQILQYLDGANGPVVRYLEPMIPTLLAVAGTWSDRFPSQQITIVADEQSSLTADALELLTAAAPAVGARLAGVTTTRSHDDPRVQLADLLAGAGRYAAARIQVGDHDELTRAVIPLLDDNGMWSDASPLQTCVGSRHG